MKHGAHTQSIPPGTASARSFPPVPAAELGFALSFFVAAAGGQLGSPDGKRSLTPEQGVQRDRLFADLLVHGEAVDPAKLLPHQSTLNVAFDVLWTHYADHPLRDALCGRVLCFYFLSTRTHGRAIERWVTASLDRLDHVFLDLALVEALACVPLNAETGLLEEDLLAATGVSAPARIAHPAIQ